MLCERVEHIWKDWHRLLTNVSNQYHSAIHSSTKFKLVGAIQDKNAIEVKTNSMLRARFKRKYEEVNVGDFCRNFKKKQKYSEMQGILKIGQMQHMK